MDSSRDIFKQNVKRLFAPHQLEMDYDHRDENPFHRRLLITPTVRAVDIVIALIRREIDDLRPKLPHIDFDELKLYVTQTIPRTIWDNFNRLLNYLFKQSKTQAVQGRDALLDTDLLRYKENSFPLEYDTDTDDAISLGASTLGISASDKMKTSELEVELDRIKNSMSSVFEEKIKEMQATITKQAEAQAEMQAKMSAMMAQIQASNSEILSSIQNSAKKPANAPIPNAPPLPSPAVLRSIPTAPPLPASSLAASRPLPAEPSKPKASSLSTSHPSTASSSLSTSHPMKAAPIKPASDSAPYDYRNELAVQLEKRRRAIERGDNNFENVETVHSPKKPNGNPVVVSMLNMIPAPGSPSRFNVSTNSACCDEEEWQ